jgi:hypothetical protein
MGERGKSYLGIGIVAVIIATIIAWPHLRWEDSSEASSFVSLKEARGYLAVFYGNPAHCEGRERMDFVEWQTQGEPKEKVWGFVLCRIGYADGPYAQEAGVHPGDVLTYGLP